MMSADSDSLLPLCPKTGAQFICTGRVTARKRSSKVAGTKVAPKFRGPAGETWTGRGVMPKWLDVLVKAGQPKEAFLIKQDSAA